MLTHYWIPQYRNLIERYREFAQTRPLPIATTDRLIGAFACCERLAWHLDHYNRASHDVWEPRLIMLIGWLFESIDQLVVNDDVRECQVIVRRLLRLVTAMTRDSERRCAGALERSEQ